MPSRWALPISASARRCSESVIKIFLLICARHELYKVFLSAKISGCAQKAGTLDKGQSKGQSWRPKITRSPDAPGGQGRAGGNPRNLHSCLHSFTFLKFKLLIYNYLQAELKDSKSGALHWACGFKSHLRHQNSEKLAGCSTRS